MELRDIALEVDGHVATLTLSGGPLTKRAALELEVALAQLDANRAVRVAVLTSAGPDFCSGAAGDLDPLTSGTNPAAALAGLRVPVIAAISGGCSGVGLELALAADVRVGSPSGRFSLTGAVEGCLPCWGGTQRLPRVVGAATATMMLLVGTELDAELARSRGLLHEVSDDPVARAAALAALVASRGPLAVELTKEAVRRGADMPLHQALRLEADFNHLLQTSADRSEGLAAFFEKRAPHFEGR
jgi:enoyl-CoA hydratase